MKQIISILFVLILNPSFSQDTSTQYKVYQEFLKLPVVIESIINSSTDECGGNYYYSTYDMDTTIKLYFNGNIIIESDTICSYFHFRIVDSKYLYVSYLIYDNLESSYKKVINFKCKYKIRKGKVALKKVKYKYRSIHYSRLIL